MSLVARLGSRFKVDLAGRIIAAISGGLLTVLLARFLNPDGYGLLFLAISICAVVEVFSKLGIAKSAARYIADYRETNPNQISHILRTSFLMNLLLIAIASVALIISSESISNILNESDLQPYLVIGGLFVIGTSLVAYTKFIAQGFEDITLSAAVLSTNHVGRFLFAVLFVLLGYGALGALVGYILAAFVASIFGLTVIYIRYYRNALSEERIESGLFRRIMEYSIPLTVTNLAGKFDSRVDTILVGFFLNPAAVSYYVISKQVIHFVGVPASALGFSISPTYGSKKASDQLDTAARMYEKSLHHTLLLYLPAAVGIFFIADPAIGMVFGNEYSGAVPVLQVLSIYAVLQAITKITDSPLDYLGRAKEKAIANGVASFGNVGLNILLIPLFGVVGAAIATLITHSMYVSVKVFIIYQELPLDVKSLVEDFVVTGFVIGGMTSVVWFFSNYISGWVSLILVVLLGFLVWFILSLATGALDYKIIRETI